MSLSLMTWTTYDYGVKGKTSERSSSNCWTLFNAGAAADVGADGAVS